MALKFLASLSLYTMMEVMDIEVLVVSDKLASDIQVTIIIGLLFR